LEVTKDIVYLLIQTLGDVSPLKPGPCVYLTMLYFFSVKEMNRNRFWTSNKTRLSF